MSKSSKRIITLVAVLTLVAILGICLVACNADSYTKKLEGKDYVVVDRPKLAGDGVEWALSATNKDLDSVQIVKYAKAEDAKEAYENVKQLADNSNGKMAAHKSGNVVMYGTTQGVKDAK